MKPRTVVMVLLIILVAVVGLNYVRVSMLRSAALPEPARSPSLANAPVRVYGRIEPLGREVFVGPVQPGRVIRTMVEEGHDVSVGQPLYEIEGDVARQALQVAIARVGEFKAKLDMILDELKRLQPLLGVSAVTEAEVTQKLLEAQMLRKQIVTAEAEVELKRRELEILTLRSPIEGHLYKFDVRLGEHLTTQDVQRIVLGKRQKQVRLFVESFWVGRVEVGDSFVVHDAESLRLLGKGKVVYVSAYTGTRDFRTEDALERLDTRYVQAILQLEDSVEAPLGSLVVCERLVDPKRQ
jgi:multidrug efflux pump subunit AcrA (membrane-fusion protein)